LTQERLVSQLASFFGVLALGLAAIGLFGVMSYVVSRRRAEFGVRLALGAQPGHLVTTMLRDCFVVAVGGLAIGVPAVVGVAHLVSGLLFGVAPTDPSTIAVAAMLLAAVAAGAGLVPAWRAGRVDPIVTLRCE
jgi:ABC-type antimicrobial peptide transport system permease subunit